MSDKVGLDVSIIVFAGPNVASFSLDDLGNHIVNKSVFIPNFFGFEFGLIDSFVEVVENILESAVISLEDGILGGHVEGVVSSDSVLEAGMGESFDGAIVVEHEETNS